MWKTEKCGPKDLQSETLSMIKLIIVVKDSCGRSPVVLSTAQRLSVD